MKKERFSILMMLLGIMFLAACSDKDDPEPAFKVSVSPTTLTLKVGETAKIAVSGAPDGAQIVWSCSDDKVAKVTDGSVEALGKGTAKITVVAKKGSVSAEAACALTVEDPAAAIVNIPDAKLKSVLLGMPGVDANKDGNISVGEAKGVHKIVNTFRKDDVVDDKDKIASLEGLQYFENLDTLDLNYNKVADASPIYKLSKMSQLRLGGNALTSIDVSNFKELKDLRIFKNAIKELSLTNNTLLGILDIHETLITELSLDGFKELTTFVATENTLTSLKLADLPKLSGVDLSNGTVKSLEVVNLPKLEKLYALRDKISSIKLENLPVLQFLTLSENEITKVDFDLPGLMFLTMDDNKVTEADFSKMPKMFRCYMSKNLLKKVDFSKNTIVADIALEEMPNLEEINLKNGQFAENSDYAIFYNNPKLKLVRVDAGAEEAYVRGLAQNLDGVQIVTE